ncbi:YD repeat-containing protein, partial [Pseudomonas abietaniphila]
RRCVVSALERHFTAFVQSPRKLGEAAPTLRSVYRYSIKPTLGSTLSDWLALDSETLLQVDTKGDIELQRTETQYIDNVSDPFLFGRIKRESQTLNGQTSHTDYSYESSTHKRGNEKVQKTTKTLSTAFTHQEANATKTVTLEHSLLSGLPLLDQDEKDIEINYRYDALGRIVEEIVSPGTDYTARRLYTYKLCSQPGDKASQSAVDVNDVTVFTELDGLGRAIAEYHQNIYQKTPDALKVQAWKYNAYGQLERETSWDHWQPEEGQPLQALELTSAYAYNAWGAVNRTTRPDGVVDVNEFDPITLKRTAWQETQATVVNWSETVSNGFDKPLTVRQRAGAQYLEQTYAYDGLGRCVESTDAMDNTSGFAYDAWGRLLHTQLPDMTVVSKTYAPHTREALPVRVQIVPDNEALPSVLVGEQLFDGLNRLKQLTVGPRTSHYRYTAGQMTVSECETPSQQRLQYTYELGLTGLPKTSTAPDETTSFSYDPKTAQITTTHSTQGQHDFEYDLAGHLRRESWTDTNRLAGRKTDSGKAEPFSVTYNSSLSGRQISRVDVTGLKTLYEHDLLGRLNSIHQGELRADFNYWPTGWLKTTTCTDLNSQQQLETALDYDDLGRETLRTLSVDGKALRSVEQTYQPDNKLATRRLCEGDTELHAETFTYDVRGRLTVYTRTPPVTGTLGDAIIQQQFTFDSLDNITALATTFADGRIEKSTYHFDPADPCQLKEIRYDDPGKSPIRLEYDADGNLTKDQHGQVLRYDS